MKKPLAAAGVLFLMLSGLAAAKENGAPASLGRVRNFSLVERSGRAVTNRDLLGHYWIADFIFTRCGGPCPLLSNRMALLQKQLPPEVRLVSFTVDPDYDTPKVLSLYADRFWADPQRWLFLTGKKEDVYDVIRKSFHAAVEPNRWADAGSAVTHSTLFALVDAQGAVRAIYHGDDWDDLKRVSPDYRRMSLADNHPLVLRLPEVNALLNAACFLLLSAGFWCIRNRKVLAHKLCMVSALGVSLLFLASYLTYHAYAGSMPFRGAGWTRPVYFAILISHSVLAALVPPLALVTLAQAWKGNFPRHVALARWTFPIWIYVSVTGVTIYAMLYRLP